MSFILTHRYGAQERSSSTSLLSALLRELDDQKDDTEHGSVAVTHESEWCMSVSRGGYVTFEHLEGCGKRHMRGISEAKILELWGLLAAGDIASIQKEPWKPGYQ
jgi:hypothetical protein